MTSRTIASILTRHTALLALLSLGLSACTAVGYYAQTVAGHLALMHKRVPIHTLLNREDTPQALKIRLAMILKLREFTTTELALPNNGSYLSYADLGRSYVLWSVFATPELSLQPVSSCFLFVGCLSYRGYFDERRARDHAAMLQKAHLDVYVAGVSAYSTLGWFHDPILNTMLRWDDYQLIKTLVHELAHQKLYIKGDSEFNEAFANAVAKEGVKRWQLQELHPDSLRLTPTEQVVLEREADFVAMLLDSRDELEQLFTSTLDDAQKRADKAQIYKKLQSKYVDWKHKWPGFSGYDQWMAGDMNNAKISNIAVYHRLEDAFTAIIDYVDGALEAFYAIAENLGRLPKTVRSSCLNTWAQGAIPDSSMCMPP